MMLQKDNFFENMNRILKENKKIYEPAHEILVLNTEVTSKDSDKPVHLISLTRVIAAQSMVVDEHVLKTRFTSCAYTLSGYLKIIFLILNQNLRCWYSKESSQ